MPFWIEMTIKAHVDLRLRPLEIRKRLSTFSGLVQFTASGANAAKALRFKACPQVGENIILKVNGG